MSSRDLANLKNGLVAAWIPSLGSTGYRLVDRVGSNHGVLTNMDASDWVVSGGNLALDFDGTDDYVVSSDLPITGNETRLTIACWCKPANVNTVKAIFALGNESSGQRRLLLQRNAVFEANGYLHDYTSSGNVLTSNEWQHLCVVYTSYTLSSGISLYRNGLLLSASATLGTSLSAFTNRKATFAANNDGTENWAGQLDDVRIYNRPLSAGDIKLLASERGIGFKTSSRTSSHFAKRYAYKPPKDKTYAAITRSQSDYDSLREGLVLAICPSVSGATGYRAVDVSGRGNHGTLTNMDAATDWVASNGMALDFDGSNDFVNFGTSLNSRFVQSSAYSISAWIYATSVTSNRTILTNAKITPNFDGMNFYVSGGLLRFDLASDSALQPLKRKETSSAVIATNTWYHVTVTKPANAATSAISLYVNGTQPATSDAYNDAVTDTTNSVNLQIGCRDGTNSQFAGFIDDVRIYNRILTPPEIRRLASRRGIGLQSTPRHTDYIETREKTYSVIVKSQQEHSSLSEGLVGAWCPSLGASGYRLVDRSGYGNHGTLTNMTSEDWVVSGGAGALDFDGSNDRVEANALRYSALPLTIACWVKPNTVSGVQMLASHYGAEGNRAWYLALINNAVRILVSPDGTAIPYGQGGTVTTDWTHVVGVIGASAFQIYLNGNAVSTTLTGSYPTSIFNSTANVIFADRATTDTPLNGQLDDIRIYNRVLTPPEIRQLASRRGIGLQSRPKQYTYYQFPSGSKRRRLLTGMP